MNPYDLYKNPVIRMLGVALIVASCIRLLVILIMPVIWVVLAGLIIFVVFRIVSWYRGVW